MQTAEGTQMLLPPESSVSQPNALAENLYGSIASDCSTKGAVVKDSFTSSSDSNPDACHSDKMRSTSFGSGINRADSTKDGSDAGTAAGINLLFMKRLSSILPLLFPGPCSLPAVLFGLLLLTCILEQYVVYQVGLISSHYYLVLGQMDWPKFVSTTLYSLGLVVAIAVVLSGKSYISNVLYISWRQVLSRGLHRLYFAGINYYTISIRPDLGLDNPDMRMTQDVDLLCSTLGTMASSLLIAPFKIAYYTYQAYAGTGWLGPTMILVFFLLSSIVNRFVMDPIVPCVVRAEKCEGDLRFKHMQIRSGSESVAFHVSGAVEATKTNAALDSLVRAKQTLFTKQVKGQGTGGRVTSVSEEQFWLNLCQNLFDYLGSILSYLAIAVPIFGGVYDGVDSTTLSSIISKNGFVCIMLISSLSSLVALCSSVVQVAGATHRVAHLLEALVALHAVWRDTNDNAAASYTDLAGCGGSDGSPPPSPLPVYSLGGRPVSSRTVAQVLNGEAAVPCHASPHAALDSSASPDVPVDGKMTEAAQAGIAACLDGVTSIPSPHTINTTLAPHTTTISTLSPHMTNTSTLSPHTTNTFTVSPHTTITSTLYSHKTSTSTMSPHTTNTFTLSPHTTNTSTLSSNTTNTTLFPHTTNTTVSPHTTNTSTVSPHTTNTSTVSPHTTNTSTLSSHTTNITILSPHTTNTSTLSPHTTNTSTLSPHTTNTFTVSPHTTNTYTLAPHTTNTVTNTTLPLHGRSDDVTSDLMAPSRSSIDETSQTHSSASLVNTAPSVPQFTTDVHMTGTALPLGFLLQQVTLRVPRTNATLVHDLTLHIRLGHNLLIMGPSSCGKSSLLRALRGLWPIESGVLAYRSYRGPKAVMFMPQRPFLTNGTLREQIVYPEHLCGEDPATKCRPGDVDAEAGVTVPNGPPSGDRCVAAHGHQDSVSDRQVSQDSSVTSSHVQDSVRVSRVTKQNTETEAERNTALATGDTAGNSHSSNMDNLIAQWLEKLQMTSLLRRCGGLDNDPGWIWADVLSPGEVQRLVFLRVLHHRPHLALLDEATSAVSGDMEETLYGLAAAAGVTVVSVGHRHTLKRYHHEFLVLDGRGGWTLQRLQ